MSCAYVLPLKTGFYYNSTLMQTHNIARERKFYRSLMFDHRNRDGSLGFVSLTENLMMVAMAFWMLLKPAGLGH